MSALDAELAHAKAHPLKQCKCCDRIHTAAMWAALPLLGYVGSRGVDDVTLEMRNCPCGSTLAVEATP